MSDHECWNTLDLVTLNLEGKAAGFFIPPLFYHPPEGLEMMLSEAALRGIYQV